VASVRIKASSIEPESARWGANLAVDCLIVSGDQEVGYAIWRCKTSDMLNCVFFSINLCCLLFSFFVSSCKFFSRYHLRPNLFPLYIRLFVIHSTFLFSFLLSEFCQPYVMKREQNREICHWCNVPIFIFVHQRTARSGRMVSTAASCFRGPGFKSRSEDQLSWLIFLWFPSVSPGEC
jgi:hypothetical protein